MRKMSFKFVFGRSGAGKSTYVFNQTISAATANPKKRYMVIVPDQFTMQTQADLVKMSPNGGIMNIEVLSFSRLAHRIFEETGGNRTPVLEDTGKNLILRRCAANVRDSIPYLAANIDKAGYIHEIKSAISEFMQYDIGENELNELINFSGERNRRSLAGKLKDLAVIYESFKGFIGEQYITTEEAMDILAKELYESEVIKDSVVVIDGFTGFTPVQNKVIAALMDVCEEVIMTLTIDYDLISTNEVNEQNLFAFTYKTYQSMLRLAKEHSCDINTPVIIRDTRRYEEAADLKFMESNLFRYPTKSSAEFEGNIHITVCNDIKDEIRVLAGNIRKLVRDKGAYYRDIAVITGNMSAYESELKEKFEDMSIPVYIDETKGLVYLILLLSIYALCL